MKRFGRRKSRITAPATVYFGQAKNENDQKQLAVWVECHYSGTRLGPIWSHEDRAIRRALATLTSSCDCGRRYHKAKFFEGRCIRTKPG